MKKDLKSIIKIFGEEKEASKIAKNIVKQEILKKLLILQICKDN